MLLAKAALALLSVIRPGEYVSWSDALALDPIAIHPSMKYRMEQRFEFTLDATTHLNLVYVQFPTDCDEDAVAVRNTSLIDRDRVVTVYSAELPFTFADEYLGELEAGRYELVYWMAGPSACRIDEAKFALAVRNGPPPPPPPPPPPVLAPIDSEYALIKSWVGFDRGVAVEVALPDFEVAQEALVAPRVCFSRDPGPALAATRRPHGSSGGEPKPLGLVPDTGGADPRPCYRGDAFNLHEYRDEILEIAFGDGGRTSFTWHAVRDPFDERLVVRTSAPGNLFGTTQWRTPRLTPRSVQGHLCANTTVPLHSLALVSPDGATRQPLTAQRFGQQCYDLGEVPFAATGIWKLEAGFGTAGILAFPLVVEAR